MYFIQQTKRSKKGATETKNPESEGIMVVIQMNQNFEMNSMGSRIKIKLDVLFCRYFAKIMDMM